MSGDSNGSNVDPAALAAAVFAAALTTLTPEGPFAVLTAIIGVTLLLIVCSYEYCRKRYFWQNVAFGAVCALVSLLLYGFIREALEAGNFDTTLNAPVEVNPAGEKIIKSRIANKEIAVVWALLSVLFTYVGSLGSKKAKKYKEVPRT